eukprot:scaffold35177_cov146-Isochrysis_galbana.AAC.1
MRCPTSALCRPSTLRICAARNYAHLAHRCQTGRMLAESRPAAVQSARAACRHTPQRNAAAYGNRVTADQPHGFAISLTKGGFS